MKKIVFLLTIVSSFFVGAVYAQDASFGFKGGLNITSLGGDAEGVSFKPGAHAGFFARIDASDNVIFQPELIFSMQGANLDGDGGKVNYNYVNLPLMFKIYPGTAGFNVQMGPQVGFLVLGEFSDGDIAIDIKEQLNAVDFALGAGVGYDAGKVLLDFRYNYGLNSTAEDDTDGTFPNRTIQLSIGFLF
ncbi:MAG: porin family protein [Bacteroidota bacterium]